jgi:hypothetical protein
MRDDLNPRLFRTHSSSLTSHRADRRTR